MTIANFSNPDPVTRRTAMAIVGSASAAGMLSMGTACESLKEMMSSSDDPVPTAAMNSTAHRAGDPQWDMLVGQEFQVLGSTFTDSGAGAGATLVLLESLGRDHSADPARPDGIRDDSVSLLFASKQARHLESGTYTLENPTLGRFPLFIHHCPHDHDHRNTEVYEAVLN